MLFATNRVLKQSNLSRSRPIDFELRDTNALQSIFFCERTAPFVYREVDRDEYLQSFKDSPAKQLLVFIHGFNNVPEDAIFARAEALQMLFDDAEPNLVQVLPLVWPCRQTNGTKEFIEGYYEDQHAADASNIAYGRLLQKLQDWQFKNVAEERPCLKRINVLAHSMGNRVLRGALRWWSREVLGQSPPLIFRNLFLTAADIENDCLESGREGEHLAPSTRNVVVYHSFEDIALRASKAANASLRAVGRRMGHTGPYDMSKVADNVFAVNCDSVAMEYDPGKGHTYFLTDSAGKPGAVFKHLLKCVQSGKPEVDAITRRFTI